MQTIDILGTPLTITSYAELSRWLLERDSEAKPLAVDFANTHIVTLRRHEAAFRTMSEAAMDIFCPDGMPLVWYMRWRGAAMHDRVYGPTFTRYFLTHAPASTTHYLVGGSEEYGVRFRERMLALNPSLRFVGGFHGMCSIDGVLDEDERVAEEIQRLKPDFIWVGLGTPKQYAWISRIKPRIVHGTLLAVGFAFDVNAGMKPDAPMWMQRYGLTWLYRMITEPKRLFPRYVKWNTLFVFYLLQGIWKKQHPKPQRPDNP